LLSFFAPGEYIWIYSGYLGWKHSWSFLLDWHGYFGLTDISDTLLFLKLAMIIGRMKLQEAQLRQELHNNQDNNNDSQHVDETACKRNAGKDRLPEETEQPESGQHQDRQAKHGIPLYESAFVTRSVFPGDMIWRSIKIG
jgi:hypothetical protein